MRWSEPGQNLPQFDRAARDYVRNLLVATHLGRECLQPDAGERVHPLHLEALHLIAPAMRRRGEGAEGEPDAGARRAFERRLARWAGRPAETIRAPGWLLRNLRVLAREAGLDDLDVRILCFVVTCAARRDLHELATKHFDGIPLGAARSIVAAAIAAPVREVTARLARSATLVSTGLVELGTGLENLASLITASDKLVDLVLGERLSPAALHEAFVPLAPPGTLALEDYDHMQPSVSVVCTLLDRALCESVGGVNVLFYGPTGTGKTELACALARALGASLHRLGAADEEGDSPSSQERLQALALGNRLLRGRMRNVLLFDELEDLLETPPIVQMMGFGGSRPRMSKQWFNRLLEENPVPTIWITNDAKSMDAAFRRRFRFAIRFEEPGLELRRRLWKRYTSEYASLDGRDLEHLACRYEANPGLIHNAADTAGLVARDRNPSLAEIETVLAPTLELTTGARLPRAAAPALEDYRLGVLNVDADLERLVERIAARPDAGGQGISLCLYGPPGTGKTAFVRHLAGRVGRRLVVKAASDLLSPWLGATEQGIARAFEEAARDDAVLLFDEVDSFLRDRRGAVRSWEVTEVNEFLQRLEAHPGVVACTTNRFDDLDPAAMRRFVFKIRFGWLRPVHAVELFHTMLGSFVAADATDVPSAEARIARMQRLALGDFAAVRRRLASLGARLSARAIADELASELAARGAAPCRPGFELNAPKT